MEGTYPVAGTPGGQGEQAPYLEGAVLLGRDDARSPFLPPIQNYHEWRQNQPPSQWQTGFWDCLADRAICCEVLWCEHCQLAYSYGKLKTGVLGPDWTICVGAFCADLLLHGGATAFLTWDMRNKIRMRWNIDPEANDITECCKSFCCAGCAACQVYREMTYRGHWPGGMCISDPPHYAGSGATAAPSYGTPMR